jgi:hypothetical protein
MISWTQSDLGTARLGHADPALSALRSRNRTPYQQPLLGTDGPDQVALKAVCVDDSVGLDQPDQGAACVSLLQPLVSTSGAGRGEGEWVLHDSARWC